MNDIHLRELMMLRPPGAFPGNAPDKRAGSSWELGCMFIALEPRAACQFAASPARSLHAALLRRIEQVNADASFALHAERLGAHSTERPWTVSSLLGPLDEREGRRVALPERLYWVRLTALSRSMVSLLHHAFTAPRLQDEPLFLENVPFDLVSDGPLWTALASYGSLYRAAVPEPEITLEAISPTGFRTRDRRQALPEPRTCIPGYLRKWNAFSPRPLPEKRLVLCAEQHLFMEEVAVRFETLSFGEFSDTGLVGRWRWHDDGGSPATYLRMLNALSSYAFFCGTGVKTTMGMGQTIRLRAGGTPAC